MNKIVIHWSASTYTPNSTDKEHYHYLIDGNAKVIKGKYKPEDNLNCNDGKYAAHCGGGNTGCYDDITEVLTNNGWKLFKNVDINKDKFFTMNNAQNPEYQRASEYFKYYIDDELISFKNKSCDLMVTKNHNMVLLSEKTKKNYFKTAQEIENYSSVNIPMNNAIKPSIKKYFKLNNIKIDMNLWLMFLGIYISEGCCDKSGNKNNCGSERYRVTISQSKTANIDKYKMIINMLNKLPFKYIISGNNIEIHDKNLCLYLRKLGYSYEKHIPKEFKYCSEDQLNILWYWLLMGDGCFGSGNTEHYYTTSKRLVDDLQEMLAIHGYRSVIYTKEPKDRNIEGRIVKKENCRMSYDLIKLRRKNTYLDKSFSKRKKYKGYVYCVTVPNHTLLTRRNGKIQWSGNSIGIALCGMAGYKSPTYIGHFPLKQIQFERAFKLAAELCKTYNIPISAQTVFTHYEFGRQHPNTSSAGKIDINFIPYNPALKPDEVGDFIRGKVKYYYEKL